MNVMEHVENRKIVAKKLQDVSGQFLAMLIMSRILSNVSMPLPIDILSQIGPTSGSKLLLKYC